MVDSLLHPLRDVPGHTIFNNGEVRLLSDGGTLRLDVVTSDRRAHHTVAGLGGDRPEIRRRYTAAMARKLGQSEAERVVGLAFGHMEKVNG